MKKTFAWMILLVLLGSWLYLAVGLDFGHPAYSDLDDYYIQNGQAETGANNIVTSVVFDYRAFDTLGEASVLFTAVLGVSLMFRKLGTGEEV